MRRFNRDHRDEHISAHIINLHDLEVAYEDYKGSSARVAKGRLDIENSEVLEQEGPYGKSFVATIPGSSLGALFDQHGNGLFDQNVRLVSREQEG